MPLCLGSVAAAGWLPGTCRWYFQTDRQSL